MLTSESLEEFNAQGSENLDRIKPLIRESWKRCLAYNLDPQKLKPAPIGAEELKRRRLQCTKLLRIAKGILENLYDSVKGNGFAIVLLDAECCVMEVLGDPEFLKENELLRQGEQWGEQHKGTNAMSLAQMGHKPQQIAAGEHFSQCNNHLTCSAAPIFDPSGHLVGIIDVSGYAENNHAHTLGMVISAARAIEDGMRLEAANQQINDNLRILWTVMESVEEAVITVDKDGYITGVNKAAFNILDKNSLDCRGKPFANLLPNQQELLDNVLKHGRYTSITTKDKMLLNGFPIMNQRQNVCGGVITIHNGNPLRQDRLPLAVGRPRITFDDIIGESDKLLQSLKTAKDVAGSFTSIYIEGESGTGKEMLAQSIHNDSLFANGPFVAISCAAIPQTLIESELFGYEDGTFSGGKKGGKAGKFELANNGTLFLDEIADMPLDTQVSLLRVLQEKQVVRIGGYRPIPVDIRVLSATNKCLDDEVRKGNFRSDLYYRLNVINIKLPPLRERDGDILLLARHFQSKFSERLGYPLAPLQDDICEILCKYPWPGNVRELSNAMERAVNLAKGGRIKAEHLPENVSNNLSFAVRSSSRNQGGAMNDYERQLLEDTLRSMNGNISKSATHLGISRNTLYRKMEKYNIKYLK